MRRLSLVVLSLFALQIWNVASASTVGRTPGQFGVSATGAATYTIPIWAPPGPQGVGPQIALTYNSQSGIGPEGMGWSISGLSSISRCNLTVAQDGAPAAVALTYRDAFCLDGQRLRLTSSEDLTTYGKDGTTYQTEVANFSNVTAHGVAGLGPSYFTVQGRNGWTYEYGNTTDSRIIPGGSSGPGTASSWMLDKVTDRSGNTMTVAWETASANLAGMTVPATISWTQGQYTMGFFYEALPEPIVSGYLGGLVVQSNYLLASVLILGPGGIRKNYVLGYPPSPTTSQSTLTSVTECADFNQTNCLYPTTMTYQSGQTGISTANPITLPASSYRANDALYSGFDLNGDGINDLVYYDSGMWYVAFGSPSGYSAPISTGITDPAAMVGNIDASGSAAFVANQNSQWWYFKWNAGTQTFPGTYLAAAPAHEYSPTLADINGDGLADLVYIDADTTDLNVIYNTSTGSGVSFQSSPTNAGSVGTLASVKGAFGSQSKLDFTGDGQGDLLGLYAYDVYGAGYATYYVLHFSGGAYPSTFTSSVLASAIPATTGLPVDVGDYNDDGCMDLMFENQLVFSGCNGTSSTSLGFDYPAVGGINWDGGPRRAVLADDQGELVVYESLGNTLAAPIDTGMPFNSANAYLGLPNPTGDGLDALGVFNQTSSPASIQYYLHNGAGQPPDLLTKVTDGYGNSASPAYVSIAQSSYAGTADAVYPYANYAGPLYVVNNVTFSDPSSAAGATYSNGYSYTGAWMNLQGRGFSGFNSVRRTDTRTVPLASPSGLFETTYYERAFPYTGMMFEDTVADSLFSVSDTTQTPTCTPFPSCTPPALDSTAWNQRYFAYFPTVVTNKWELNGDPITTNTTTYNIPDAYGNFQSIKQVVTDNDPGAPPALAGKSWTTTVTNTPDVDNANWCLSLNTQQTVAYSSTDGGAPVTRTTGFTPDTINCRYTQKVTEPAGSAYSPTYTVTEDLRYDSFGNLYTDTVTGNSMTARQTKQQWNSTGQFLQTLTNALNQTTTFGFDSFWGTRTSAQDPNGITQRWVYDPSFGRLTEVQRPDGTYAQIAYIDCANTCLFGAHAMVVSTTVYNSDQTVMTDGTDYYDTLDRPLVSTQRSLANGSYSRNELRYDNLGNVSSRSAPCTWVSITSVCPPGYVYVHDALNRQTSAQLQAANLPTTSWVYSGNTMVQKDPSGNARTLINDSAGRFRETVDANGYGVILSYDAAGSLTERADSLGRTLWTSGTSLSGPGAIQYGVGAFAVNTTDLALGTRTATFDALGERVGLTDANGNTTSWQYDALARATTRTETDAAATGLNFFTQWNWDGAANGIGRLQSVCTLTGGNPLSYPLSCTTASGGYSESYGYDSAGRLQQQSIMMPGPSTYTYQLAYNSSGLLSTLTYPTTVGNPLQIQYEYNNGLLQSVEDANDSVTVWTAGVMNPAGQVTQETLGNSVVVNRTFDPTSLQLRAITAGVNGGPLLEDQGYLYFPTGNVKQRQDSVAGLTENFSYDSLNRLYSSQLVTQAGTSNNLQMCYDNTGSGCSETVGGPGLITSKTADTVPPVSYAATWTPYNYPASISSAGETVDLSYGPDRQRWQQNYNHGTEITNYIGKLLEQVTTSTGTTYRHYIYAGTEPVAIWTPGSPTNKLEYMLADNEGSISALVNSGGTTDVNESFTAYGARRNPSTGVGPPNSSDLTTISGITRQGYTFQTALGQSMELNHMNGRVQDAITGQFLSPDPRIPDPTNTQDYNRYGYVDNNPTTQVDPSGFDSMSCGLPTQVHYYAIDIWDALNSAGKYLFSFGQWNPLEDYDQSIPNCVDFAGQSSNNTASTTASSAGKTAPQTRPWTICPRGILAADFASATPRSYLPPSSPDPVSGMDVVSTVGALNDTTNAIATILAEAGSDVTGVAGKVARGAPVLAVPVSAYTLSHGMNTGNSDEIFSGGYGFLTLGVAALDSPMAIGMALAKVGIDVATPPPPSILDQAASGRSLPGCPVQ